MKQERSAEWLRGGMEALEGIACDLETPSLRLIALECRNRKQALADLLKEVEVSESGKSTADEVIAEAKKALGSIAWFLNAGVQETSMAPRCCPVCSKVQLDGRNEHYKSCNAVEINAAIASIAEWEDRHK